MNMYRVVEETDDTITYEFRTLYLYGLYAILAAMILGSVADIDWLTTTGIILMILYCLVISFPSVPLHRKIKAAMSESSITSDIKEVVIEM